MKITKRQLKRIIERIGGGGRYSEIPAHPRGDLGKNIADVDFPIIVGYELQGKQQSEIAYNQDELDNILDSIAPSHGPPGIPYSLNSLSEIEPDTDPVGSSIDRYSEGKMKITKRQLRKIVEGYNSMSDAGRSLAARAKRHFHKDYPEVRVGINAMDGWIEVEGRKAVNMSSASGRPMSLEDVVDKMKQAYLGHPLRENKMKITKRQLRRIIKEEKARLDEAYQPDPMEIEFAQNDLKAMQGIIQEFQTGMKMAMDPDRITGIVDDQLVADIRTIMEMAESLRQKIYDQR